MQMNWRCVWFTDKNKFKPDDPDLQLLLAPFQERKKWYNRVEKLAVEVLWFGEVLETFLVILKGKIDSKTYQNCLNDHLKSKIRQGKFLVQDNTPVYLSLSTWEWVKDEKIEIIDWLAYSPELNPIKNIWVMRTQIIYAHAIIISRFPN